MSLIHIESHKHSYVAMNRALICSLNFAHLKFNVSFRVSNLHEASAGYFSIIRNEIIYHK